MKIIAFLVGLIFLSPNISDAQAKSFYILNPEVEQGDVLIIIIEPQWQTKAMGFSICASVKWDGSDNPGQEYTPNNYGKIFIGIEVDMKPGEYIVFLVECGRGVRLDWYYDVIKISERSFGKPWYRTLPKRNPKISARREEEKKIKNEAYAKASVGEDYTDGDFVNPLNSITTNDSFGTPRIYGVYNKKTKTWMAIKGIPSVPHGGVDLQAKIGTPVKAINSGLVLLAHDFPLSGTEGKMIILDHGSGILSLYLHLSRFKVKAGNSVKKGEIIALSGATPKGTPPHLHFMTRVNETNVDPLRFIELANQYLVK